MVGSLPGAASGPVSAAVLREVLGHFVSGIVVVTAVDADGPLGFTCQSFTSLSLDPPLVSFCPALTSRTWPRIRAVGALCVNVLAADHQHYSTAFARSGVDKFAGLDWRPAPSGSPILDGVSAWFDCTLWGEHDGGDHTIAVAQVHDLAANPQRLPLLYYRGRYGVTGEVPTSASHPNDVSTSAAASRPGDVATSAKPAAAGDAPASGGPASSAAEVRTPAEAASHADDRNGSGPSR